MNIRFSCCAIVMGAKVNVFVAVAAIGTFFGVLNFLEIFVTALGFVVLYNYWKSWKYVGKFPGGKKISVRGVFENSSSGFYENVKRQWKEYGRDKFVVWIGLERFVAVTKFEDVKVILDADNDGVLVENFGVMWPWIGCDSIKKGDFQSTDFTSVIKSSALNELTKSPDVVERISKRFGALCKHNIPSGDVVDIQELSRVMMFDILVLIATGNNVGPQRKEMFEEAEKLTSLADSLVFSGLRQSSLVRSLLMEDVKFSKARASFIKRIGSTLSAENNLIANSVFKVVKQQCPQLDAATFLSLFVILGYDRLSVAFTSAILELAGDEKLQEELCSEIRENKRYFITCEKLEHFLKKKLTKTAITPVIVKHNKVGVPLNGFFIPPETGVLLFIEGEETYGKLIGDGGSECLTMNLMKTFAGEFIVRCKFHLDDEKKVDEGLGCGTSLRRKNAKILVRNRY